jgi:Tol biopolymer transport system component
MLAFIRSNGGMSLSEIYLLSLDRDLVPTAQPRQLTTQACWIANPVWMQSGEEIAFSCGQWGPGRRLFRMPISGTSKPSLVGSVADDVSFLAVSHSSQRLIYTQESMDWDIWRVELGGPYKKFRIKGKAERFLSSTRTDTNPQYSPDGKRIAFESSRSGRSEIWIADADGSHEFQLSFVGSPSSGYPRWSPDGNRIVFHSRRAVHASIFVIDARGGRAQQLEDDSTEDVTPSWSQDGRWVYFSSRRSGDAQIWKIPADGGSAVRVTNRGGRVPFEAGQFLWYSKQAGQGVSLWKVPRTGGTEVCVLERLANPSTYAVTSDGVYFIRRDQTEGFSLQYLDFNTNQMTPLGAVEGTPVHGLAISSDLHWMLYNRLDRRDSDLMLVENFH